MLGGCKLQKTIVSLHTPVAAGFSQSASSSKAIEKPMEVELNEANKMHKKRMAGRRSKLKNNNYYTSIKIIHSNTDGYTSKKESINEIAKAETPDVMTLNDTNLKGKLKVKVPGYFSFDRNREKHKGGVSTVIANHLKHNTMKVAEGEEEDEYIITRLDNTVPAITRRGRPR